MENHTAALVITLFIVSVSSCATSGSYNVSLSCASESNSSCYTVATILNGSGNISLSDSKLVFSPGEHSLVGERVAIANVENLTFVGSDTASVQRILCTNSSFVFSTITNLRFVNVEFTSCQIELSAVSALFNDTSFNDGCAFQGGAIAIYNKSNVSFNGQTSFAENKAIFAGGAIFSDISTISFSGNVTFRDNWSGPTGGGAIFTVGSDVWFRVMITLFSGNRVSSTDCSEPSGDRDNLILERFGTYSHIGGALRIYKSAFAFSGSTSFIDNQAGFNQTGEGGGVFLDANSVISFDGDTEFLNNSAGHKGNGIYADFSNVSFNGTTYFASVHRASDGGGAIYLKDMCNATFKGESRFERNSAGLGGALYVWHNNLVRFDGRTIFTHNSARRGAAARVSRNVTLTFSGHTEFSYNTVTYKGGALDFDHQIRAYFEGNTTFMYNAAPMGPGGAIVSLDLNIVNFEGNHVFRCNSAKLGGAINSKVGSLYSFSGNTNFVNNIATVGGGIYMSKGGILRMTENTYFHNNTASYLGGGLAVRNSNVSLKGNTTITKNRASYGGGIFVQDAQLMLNENGRFEQNCAAADGGAIFASGSVVYFDGIEWIISGNTADNGGGIALAGFTFKVVYLRPQVNLYFEDNLAYSRGGAMYVEDNRYVYCEFEGKNQTKDSCFMQHKQEICQPDTPIVSELSAFDDIRLHFVNNSAQSIGHVLHGGSLHSCYWCIGRDEYAPGYEAFNFIANITSSPDRDFDISSDPFHVRTCSGDSTIFVKAFPMETIYVEVNATGQNNITCPADILALRSGGISNYTSKLDLQPIGKQCKKLPYTLVSTNLESNNKGNLELYSYKPCSTSGFPLKIDVTFLPCPVGFELVNITYNINEEGFGSYGETCHCASRLHGFDIECWIQNQTILRRGDFWVGVARRNNKSGLILHSHCTLDYCKTVEVRFQLNDTDLQCADNRSGILCGTCQSGLSLALGSSHCLLCSNKFLVLLIPFSLAGILLVILLFVLEINISTGTVSGLVFYANIVRIHSDIFALDGETNVLTVFIAWLNLDLGIETCFVDGLDAYSRAWLQFVFPVYLWLLVGLVALLANASVTVAKLIGDTNPISVLATLFLLSYTKILRTVMAAFQFTTLDYPEGETVAVWLYDGNVCYVEGKHIVLFLFSLLVLLILFLPYSLVLLFGQWIETKFQVRWIPQQKYYLRLKAFLDAHHAPLKDSHRYWFGLLLILRFFILMVSAVLDAHRPQDPHTNLLVLLVIVSGLQMWGWVIHGVYRNRYLDVLEASFIFNLLILGAGTLQITLSGGDQHALVYTSIGVAFATFLAIVSYFVWMHPATKSAWSYLIVKIKPPKPAEIASSIDTTELIMSDSQFLEPSNAPTVTVIPKPPYHLTHRQSAVSLREPLLETMEI